MSGDLADVFARSRASTSIGPVAPKRVIPTSIPGAGSSRFPAAVIMEMSNTRSFLQKFAGSFFMKVGGLLLSTALSIALARMLGVSAFGSYAFVVAVISLATLPGQAGLPSIVFRETAKALADSALERVIAIKAWAYGFAFRLSMVTFGLLVIAIFAFRASLSTTELIMFLAGSCLVLLFPVNAIRAGIIRGLGHVVIAQAGKQIVQPIVFLVLIVVFFVLGKGSIIEISPVSAMAFNVISVFSVWVFGFFVLLNLSRRTGLPRQRQAPFERENLLKSVLTFGLAGATLEIDLQMGIILTGAIASDVQTGLLKLATQFAVIVGIGYAAAITAIGPKVVLHWKNGDLPALQEIVVLSARASLLYAVIAAIGLGLCAPWIIAFLVGDGFNSAYLPLLILIGGQIINSAFGPTAMIMASTGLERFAFYAIAFGLAINIAVAAVLIPVYGAIGAAVGLTISMLVRNVAMWRFARIHLNIETAFWGRIARTAADGESMR